MHFNMAQCLKGRKRGKEERWGVRGERKCCALFTWEATLTIMHFNFNKNCGLIELLVWLPR